MRDRGPLSQVSHSFTWKSRRGEGHVQSICDSLAEHDQALFSTYVRVCCPLEDADFLGHISIKVGRWGVAQRICHSVFQFSVIDIETSKQTLYIHIYIFFFDFVRPVFMINKEHLYSFSLPEILDNPRGDLEEKQFLCVILCLFYCISFINLPKKTFHLFSIPFPNPNLRQCCEKCSQFYDI